MPKRTDLRSVLIVGSGPIRVGQGCGVGGAGVPACRARRGGGYPVVLANTKPATSKTDPEWAGATSHEPPLLTDVRKFWWSTTPRLHSPTEVGQEPEYARRSATKRYRTTPLRALWQHPPYFHDGSAADLTAVVNHYDSLLHLGLSDRRKADLVEYLKTL